MLVTIAEIPCKLPGPLLSLHIKEKLEWPNPGIVETEAEKRKKHHHVGEVAR